VEVAGVRARGVHQARGQRQAHGRRPRPVEPARGRVVEVAASTKRAGSGRRTGGVPGRWNRPVAAS